MEVNEDSVITVDNILNLFQEMGIEISLDEAEEMIFEGDYNEDKSLSFHEFVDLITLVHDSELN
jgi:Ca2+-binding EF-hand superfamily protein